jgi:hypothetical protein
LFVCDKVVFEQSTQKPYLLGVFTGVPLDVHNPVPQRFDVFAALTDGQGDVTMTLKVVHLDSNQEVYSQTMTVHFPDPLKVVNLRFRIRQLTYEAPGTYLFSLAVGEEEIAVSRVHVYPFGDSP